MTYRLAEKTSLAKLTTEQGSSPVKRFLRHSIASCGVALLMMTKGHVFTTVSALPSAMWALRASLRYSRTCAIGGSPK